MSLSTIIVAANAQLLRRLRLRSGVGPARSIELAEKIPAATSR